MSGEVFVQYGCGLCAPQAWHNFDASPSLRLQRIPVMGALFRGRGTPFPANVEFGDIVRGLPLADASVDAVYCSHVLEHLALDELRAALRNTFRMLREGGVFRMVLPDLEQLAREYLGNQRADACSTFMRDSFLGVEVRAKGAIGRTRAAFGHSAHLWMWDRKGLSAELTEAGYRDVREAAFNDSELDCFRLVEDRGRWTQAFALQCRR